MKVKKRIRPQAKVHAIENGDKAIIYLYGDICSYDDYGISLDNVTEQVKDLGAKSLEVHINSYGGDVFESIAIKNFLMDLPNEVNTVIDGIAASGGSIIAMAGSKVTIHKDSQLMIHNPWTWAIGNAEELRKAADDLEQIQSSLKQVYLDKFKGTEEELEELLAKETYITAEEALTYGLVDEIINKSFKEDITDEDVLEAEEVELTEEEAELIANKVVDKLNNKKQIEEAEQTVKNSLFNLFKGDL